jgi:hypothetical protein
MMTRDAAAATLLLLAGIATADALDLRDLTPCRTAAARLCDRSQGIAVAAFWRCGATLAFHRLELGRGCLEVLRRHGQL